MTGFLGRNKRREKDTHPEYTGSIMIDGKTYWLSAWVKEKEGQKYFSISAKPKDEKPGEQSSPTSQTPDDDIPF